MSQLHNKYSIKRAISAKDASLVFENQLMSPIWMTIMVGHGTNQSLLNQPNLYYY